MAAPGMTSLNPTMEVVQFPTGVLPETCELLVRKTKMPQAILRQGTVRLLLRFPHDPGLVANLHLQPGAVQTWRRLRAQN